MGVSPLLKLMAALLAHDRLLIDNNDGLTIIDVTDPSSPAYCFVSVHGLEAAEAVDDLAPLTAETYVTAYYPVPSEHNLASMKKEERTSHDKKSADVQQHINLFKDVRLIELWMLHEAWPEDAYDDVKPDSQVTGSTDSEASVPSLSELCLRTAVRHTGIEDIEVFEATMSLPGVGAKLLGLLAEEHEISDAMVGPMIKALSVYPGRDHSVLDLSLYALTAKQVILVASHFPKTHVLNLNKNPYITSATLCQLLPSLPELTRLIVYECPSISISDILALRCSGDYPSLQAVYHRAYMMCADELAKLQNDGSTWPRVRAKRAATELSNPTHRPQVSFTFAFSGTDDKSLVGCTVPFLSPRAVVTSLCDTLEFLSWVRHEDDYRLISACFMSLPRAPNVPFAERVVGNVPGKLVLGTEGWLFLLQRPSHWFFLENPTTAYGFVKYNSQSVPESQQEQNMSPLKLEIMNLAEWLEAINATDKIETDWVEKLSGYLGKESLITREQAKELLTSADDL